MKTKKTIRKSKQPARLLKTRVIEEKTTRERILEAARELFAEMPYDRVLISGIVKRAGIAQGTFYFHFETKQAVVHALADEMVGRLQKVMDRVARDFQTTIEFIATMMKEAPEALLPYQAIMRIFDPQTLFFERETTATTTFRTQRHSGRGQPGFFVCQCNPGAAALRFVDAQDFPGTKPGTAPRNQSNQLILLENMNPWGAANLELGTYP